MPVSKSLRARVGFSRFPDGEILFRGRHIYDCMLENKAFPKPPVRLEVFKKQLDDLATAIGMAVHRDRRAIARRTAACVKVLLTMRRLGHYVETTCPDDVSTFVSSGFEHLPTAYPPPSALPAPTVDSIEQGKKGQLLVRITPIGRAARNYELRYARMDGDDIGEWKTHHFTNARIRIPVTGLTPGVTYAFQVRAFGRLGHTDWSHSLTRMCI